LIAQLSVAGSGKNGEIFTSSENPHEEFNLTKLNSDKIQVTFVIVKDVRAVCDVESKKRGFGGFKASVEACSFWDSASINNKCTVVLATVANYHTIGHEIRHCMQGNYHK
jgi:hypothetical protein